jgi:hypothetical protein
MRKCYRLKLQLRTGKANYQMGETILPKWISALFKYTVLAVLPAAATVLCFSLLASLVFLTVEQAGMNSTFITWDREGRFASLSLIYCLGVTTSVVTASLCILRDYLSRAGTVLGIVSVLAGLASCINDSYPLAEAFNHLMSWRLIVFWVMILGTLVGYTSVQTKRGARYAWIPLTEMILGLITIWLVSRSTQSPW